MPQTINGCGTWYYGKNNLVSYPGVCRVCGRQTTLSSYDTRLFAVVVMIPLVPLRRLRIIEQCTLCTRHGVMPLGDWQRAQHRADESIAAYKAKPRDFQRAFDAMKACVEFRNLQLFLQLAPEVERHLSSDPKALGMLAEAYGLFNRTEDSARLLHAVLGLKDEDQTREALAACLLKLGRPDEAAPYLEHVAAKGIPDRVDALFQLAQAYQVKGEHEKALAAFGQCEAINPAIADDATFMRLKAASTGRLGTRTAVLPGQIMKQARAAAGRRKFMKVAPVVLALAAVAYLALAWIEGKNQRVFLANGLSRPYTVQLNGVSYVLQPTSTMKVRLPEGDVSVAIVGAPPQVPAETLSIRTPFLSRPLSNRALVINPDRTAIFRRTRASYSADHGASSQDQAQSTFSGGEALQQFDGLDYVFEDFPRSISMSSGTRAVTKDGLFLVDKAQPLTAASMLMAVADQLGEGAFTRIVQRHALLEPEEGEFIMLLHRAMKPREMADFLRPDLGRRPIRMHWHRAYQSAMSESGLDEQAVREYGAMLKGEPQSKDLVYLAGRAMLDIDQSLELYHKAVEGDAPCAYAFYSLSGYHLSNGEFHEAAMNAERALHLLPGDTSVKWQWTRAAVADRQFDKALDAVLGGESAPLPMCMPAYQDEAYIRTLQGRANDASEVVANVRLRFMQSPEMAAVLARQIEAQNQYCAGDVTGFSQTLAKSPVTNDLFKAHLSNGDLTAAEQDMKQGGQEVEAVHHLLLYIAALQHDASEVAERHLKAAIESMTKGSFEERSYAAALSGKGGLPVKNVLRLRELPEQKVVILTALGLRDPGSREACFAMARKLNYDTRFPYLLLKAALDPQAKP